MAGGSGEAVAQDVAGDSGKAVAQERLWLPGSEAPYQRSLNLQNHNGKVHRMLLQPGAHQLGWASEPGICLAWPPQPQITSSCHSDI